MSLKIKSIDTAAVSISVIASLFVAILGVWQSVSVWYIAGTIIAAFVVVFFASRYVIKKFVFYKIKPIYQLITARNVSTNDMILNTAGMDDVVEEIKDELTDWTNKKSEEISRLKDNERYRKEFLGNVSHEIKTPVFTIQGYILTLLDGAIDDKEINRSYLERAEKNIDRLINIVNDLDEISKLESGDIDLKKSNFNIVSLVKEIADSMEYDAIKRSITLTLNPAGNESGMVYADRSRIGQVFVNLISNSIKYGKEGGKTQINFIDMFDKFIVEVTDDGIGIDLDHHKRIFERFYRVDKSRSREQGGTGLGLAIVKHIMEAHGEKVTLRSEPGKGTTFSFTLTKPEKQ